MKLNARGFNSLGEVIPINEKNQFHLIILGINIKGNCSAQDLRADLPSKDIRRLELEEFLICYSDGRVASYEGSDLCEIEAYDAAGRDREYLAILKSKFGNRFQYRPKECGAGWVCGCGRFNSNERLVCTCCNNGK